MIVVDVETGGLNCELNPLLSIGAVDFDTNETFYVEIMAYSGQHCTEQALQVNGIDPNTWGNMILVHAMQKFDKWLQGRDILLAGQNPSFDRDFCNYNFKQTGVKTKFPHRTVDLHTIAYAKFGRSMTADDIYIELGMPPEPKPHNALRGAIVEAIAFHKLLKI